MKTFDASFTIPLPLADAIDLVFNDTSVMDAVHGPGLWTIGPWSVQGERVMEFEMNPGNIPAPVLQIIGNGKMTARTKQRMRSAPGSVTVTGTVRPKVVGAEFVRVRPVFTLAGVDATSTSVAVTCQCCAILPPPFNTLVEDFMIWTAAESFEWLKSAVTGAVL